MTDLDKFKHGEEGTHSCCAERLKREGGKAKCCECNPHPEFPCHSPCYCKDMNCTKNHSAQPCGAPRCPDLPQGELCQNPKPCEFHEPEEIHPEHDSLMRVSEMALSGELGKKFMEKRKTPQDTPHPDHFSQSANMVPPPQASGKLWQTQVAKLCEGDPIAVTMIIFISDLLAHTKSQAYEDGKQDAINLAKIILTEEIAIAHTELESTHPSGKTSRLSSAYNRISALTPKK